jgi:maltooligosyltrehalose trehalohydrolase
MMGSTWRMQSGANLTEVGCRFDVWATNTGAVEVEVIRGDNAFRHPMETTGEGRFTASVPGVVAGDRYRFRLGGHGYPDPYSRFQPEGVHGPSEVVDPSTFQWSDADWEGLSVAGLAIYELHVGTATPEGTFRSLESELAYLRDLGVTAIELMPLAQTPGTRNWGYDGVDLFAPNHIYGRPDDLRRLVDAAHNAGLGVILDVVYNHLGPEGAYLSAYSTDYFTERHHTAWGAGLNWDGRHSHWVRQLAIDNACHWVSEYHIDGLRLDATHAILDDSETHVLQELTAAARAAAGNRKIVVIAEDERHDIDRARPVNRGGEGLDGVWADDFHHEVRVLLTNAHEGYYALYDGTTEGIASAIDKGFTQFDSDVADRPEPGDPASAFVFCIQNHDQIGNRPFGDRLHHEISLDRYRVASALLLFAPETPLLFMGQEFAASTPFLYFTDHPPDLGRLVTEGRRREFAGFKAFDDEGMRASIPDPQAESTFLASKLDWSERDCHSGVLALYRTLLHLRRNDPVLSVNDRSATAAFAPSAQIVVVHRWRGNDHRVLVANFGHAVKMPQAWLERVLGGPDERWGSVLSTDESRFGGEGRLPEIDSKAGTVRMPARTAAIVGLSTS